MRRPGALLPILLAVALPALLFAPARAAEGEVTARMAAPDQKLTVGDPVILKITVNHPAGTIFDYPDSSKLVPPPEEKGRADGPGAAPFLVEDVRPVEARPPLPGETSWAVRLRVFAPGEIVIPPLELTYRLPGSDEAMTVSTEPLSLQVESVLAGDDETPADIKPAWWLPVSWWVRILLIALALALLAGGWLAWRRYRRRRPAAPAAADAGPASRITPYERALRELERLLASRLIEEGRLKEFHVGLSEIVKRFLGGHHGFDALDRTSEEVLLDLARQQVGAETIKSTRLFLGSCDLVKFAKYHPSRPEIDATVESARSLIETGRPVPTGLQEEAAA